MPPPVAASECVEDPGSTPSRDVPAPDLPAGTPVAGHTGATEPDGHKQSLAG